MSRNKKMKITGIIAEYNPFHKGHAYHISRMRESGADGIAAVMGGNFTQRGELSFCTKFAKAKAAVAGGIDLVLEMPLAYTVSSGEDFAMGGIKILNALGCADSLSFGCEEQNFQNLYALAELLENEDYKEKLKSCLASGLGFAAARQKALEQSGHCELSGILSNPNNILGIEYLSALKKTKSSITPLPITRVGADHNSLNISGKICSASAIRKTALTDAEKALSFCPSPCKKILLKEIEDGKAPLDFAKIENAILFYLRCLSADYIKDINGVSEGLENRIVDAVRTGRSFDETVSLAVTKRYTAARIRRILICSVLGITKELAHKYPPYIRVLAANKRGFEMLKEAKKTAHIPIITKAAKICGLSPAANDFFKVENRAMDLVSLCFRERGKCGLELTENTFNQFIVF